MTGIFLQRATDSKNLWTPVFNPRHPLYEYISKMSSL